METKVPIVFSNFNDVIGFISKNSFDKIVIDLEDARIFDLTMNGLNTLKLHLKANSEQPIHLSTFNIKQPNRFIEFDDGDKLVFQEVDKYLFINFCKNIMENSTDARYFLFEIYKQDSSQ